jgi:hypothetical protein
MHKLNEDNYIITEDEKLEIERDRKMLARVRTLTEKLARGDLNESHYRLLMCVMLYMEPFDRGGSEIWFTEEDAERVSGMPKEMCRAFCKNMDRISKLDLDSDHTYFVFDYSGLEYS